MDTNNKFIGSVFDPEIPAVIKVSRIASAAILAACAAMFCMVLVI